MDEDNASSLKTISVLLLGSILLIFSCSPITEKHFKTSSESGETYVQLDLESDNSASLIRINSSYVPETLGLPGHWRVENGKITCVFKAGKEMVDDAFFNPNNRINTTPQEYNRVTFPVTADTLIIYGQPTIAFKI